ncbi:hypothetical protein ATN84_00510 [Paramesorhizobium deserti]|uniref:Uncharacterized protein n=1 Tax=Paramesorhizobium deserti TaxID=1494590 RepID=A0A135HYS6_9HYPH|nr:hypothetical protein ATN84_00510 [Paramesorhizobium deserti]
MQDIRGNFIYKLFPDYFRSFLLCWISVHESTVARHVKYFDIGLRKKISKGIADFLNMLRKLIIQDDVEIILGGN